MKHIFLLLAALTGNPSPAKPSATPLCLLYSPGVLLPVLAGSDAK
jgi:hypothetical protein